MAVLLEKRKGHSRICGTVIFGFTKTGVMKQTWSAAHRILTALILVNLNFHECSRFIRFVQADEATVIQKINTNCVIAYNVQYNDDPQVASYPSVYSLGMVHAH
jgi:hypothetical protein